MNKPKFTHKCEITCFMTECKLNTSYRTEYKRGICKAGKIAIGKKGCLDKLIDGEEYE